MDLRRSSRRSKPPERDDQPVEDARHWIKKRQDMQGLQKEYIGDEIGWGVINAMYSKIHAGSFVLHYDGELIDHAEALKRENVYSKGSFGSYMFYFKHAGQELCVDATKPTKRLGRLVNDKKDGNCKMRKIMIEDKPHLCLFAKRDILLKEELSYDYGVENLPWRPNKSNKKMEHCEKKVNKRNLSVTAPLAESSAAKITQEKDFLATASPEDSRTGKTLEEKYFLATTAANILTDTIIRPESPVFGIMQHDSASKAQIGLTPKEDVQFPEPVYDSDMDDDRPILPGYNACRIEESFHIVASCEDNCDKKPKKIGYCSPILQQKEVTGVVTPMQQFEFVNEEEILSGNVSLEDDSGLHGDFPEISVTDSESSVSDVVLSNIFKPGGNRKRKVSLAGLEKDGFDYDGSDCSDDIVLDPNFACSTDTSSDDQSDHQSDESDDEMLPSPLRNVEAKLSAYPKKEISGHESNNEMLPSSLRNVEAKPSAYPKKEIIGDTELESKSSAPKITVPTMLKNEHGDRIYDKTHSCYYCNTECLKIGRHLLTVHKGETEVLKILAIGQSTVQDKKRRNLEIDRLRYKGDFYHNLSVLKTGGELKVYRRPSADEKCEASAFIPCTHCLAFVKKHDLWRHVKQCPFNKEKRAEEDEPVVHRRLQYESEMLLFANKLPDGCSESLSSLVLSTMKLDEIKRVVKGDKLILLVGSSLLERGGSSKISYISQRMRTLARLLIELQEQTSDNCANLSDFIAPSSFDDIVQATRSLSGYSTSKKGVDSSFGKPGLALNIGYDLKKAAVLLRGQGLRSKDSSVLDNVNTFLQLFELEWKNNISTSAVRSLGDKQFEKPDVLPLTSDLLKLRDYLKEEIPASMGRLMSTPSLHEWRFLAELTASRLVVFNKRRGNECNKLTIQEFESRPKWSDHQMEDVVESLQPLEKELCKRLDLVNVRGKRGNKVPIIMTVEIVQAIRTLIIYREKIGVHASNRYVFAAPTRGSLNFLRGYDCLSSTVDRLNLQSPGAIKSTRLRKYIATVSQILDLGDTELEWLARHMGHDVNIHKEYYRLHDHTIELSKISRLLLAVDEGNASKWAGKKLDDISVDELPMDYEEELLDDVATDDFEDACNQPSKENERTNSSATSTATFTATGSDQPLPNMDIEKKKGDPKPRVKRVPWSTEESAAALTYFSSFIKQGKVPGKRDVDKCVKQHPILQSRSWKIVKDFIRNQIVRVKKSTR